MIFTKTKITKMPTGNLCLRLAADLEKAEFTLAANYFAKQTKSIALFRIDNSDNPTRLLLVKWRPFFLSYDLAIRGLILESTMEWCNSVVEELNQLFSKLSFAEENQQLIKS